MPFSFFLSYATKDSRIADDPARIDPYFKAFIDRLNMRAIQLVGEKGYVDRDDIKPGQDWPDNLAEALQQSQTMVCMYSPSYFQSEYCGKEMRVLLDRRQEYIRHNPGRTPANIIPVVWQPAKIPYTLPKIQYTAPELDLNRYGAWRLGDMG